MIGLIQSNISIILQLASCSTPALPLASNWAAFVCSTAAILPVDSIVHKSLTQRQRGCCHAVLTYPSPLQLHEQPNLEHALRASEFSRIFGSSPRMDCSKAVMRSSPPACPSPSKSKPIAMPFQQIMKVTQPSIALLTISPTPGCKRQTR